MLEVKHVSKIYRSDEVELKALDDVSINFRRSEFVSVLGPSGSGKTTLLNIIGGLDHYTSGDVVIDGVSTKDYADRDWDAYRNHKVGFVFQNYNLISHQSILANVELALTLSGDTGGDRRQKAINVLKKVGLGDHLNKRPSQLSGGQMQRVAIARALVNNPDIILADEPTGALDSKTSVQIMDLLKDIAKNKLVVMVTHNPDLAEEYSTRIVTVKDGHIMSDSRPFDDEKEQEADEKTKYTSLSFLTALKLSKNNLLTKFGRTLLTAVAGSIGIIGIALILALANGVNKYADQQLTAGSVPSAITIQRSYTETNITASAPAEEQQKAAHPSTILALDDLSDNYNITRQKDVRYNDLKSLKAYLDAHSAELADFTESVSYLYGLDVVVYGTDADGNRIKINPVTKSTTTTSTSLDLSNLVTSVEQNTIDEGDLLKTSFSEITSDRPYEVLSGKLPETADELLLVVNQDNEIPLSVAYALNLADRAEFSKIVDGLNSGATHKFSDETYNFDDIIGKTYEIARVSGSYYKDGDVPDSDFLTAKIVGVAKVKDANDKNGYLGYTHAVIDDIIEKSDGKIDGSTPEIIGLYAKTQSDKDKIKNFLDAYNNSVADAQKVQYADQVQVMTDLIKQIVNMLSYVLIAFVAISLVVSSIMIGIITYISVLERTKEIGILRAIGASKRDVVRVFRAETVIEGFIAGVIGVAVSYAICFAANSIISMTAHIDNLVDLSPLHAAILILISILLTVIAGNGPARRASKKDPVEALRSE